MRYTGAADTVDQLVLLQAAEIATTAVRGRLEDALRAADACGCRRCRAGAADTFLWAVGMLAVDADEDDV